MLFCYHHLPQYVTLRTRYSELMTLTSQYIKFITDSQRRLEDEEVRDNWLRIPNKLNPNINLTNKTINQPRKKTSRRLPKRMHFFSVCCTHIHTHNVNVRVTNSSFAQVKHETLACCSWFAGLLRQEHTYLKAYYTHLVETQNQLKSKNIYK